MAHILLFCIVHDPFGTEVYEQVHGQRGCTSRQMLPSTAGLERTFSSDFTGDHQLEIKAAQVSMERPADNK